MESNPRPVCLIVLDGFGYSESSEYNAIHTANTPVWDRLWREFPHTLIKTSGADVGLPADQMGNSEVGHLNLGAGRVVYQEFTRVDRAIRTRSFFNNQTLTDAVDRAKERGKAVHILGLLSPGGVHSHETHIHAMLELAVTRGASNVRIHAFLDGRDTPPKSAEASLRALQDRIDALGAGTLASVCGRYYAMDRDHRWPRIQAAYDLITAGCAPFRAQDGFTALAEAYARGETDEFIQPTTIAPADGAPTQIEDGDVVIFMNYRSDRARQITRPFIEPDFDDFERRRIPDLGAFVSLTEYNRAFDIPIAFPPERLPNVLGQYIADLGLRQLRIAETEKYAHVTFFFNGGRETPFEGEERILIPSPQVATYDLQPQMSAEELTDRLTAAIGSGQYDLIVCNYANPDMVGHTGNLEAAVQAIETIDQCLDRLQQAIHAVGGELLITADHGNAERMRDPVTGQPHTAHTTNRVPLVYVGRDADLLENGTLADIAPSLLRMMGLAQPPEMTGRPLMAFPDREPTRPEP